MMRLELLGAPAARGERRRLGLDRDAQLERLEHLLDHRQVLLGDPEGAHPLVQDESADALPGRHQAARPEVGDRLAHHGAADAELLDHVLLGRQLLAALVLARLDALGDGFHELRGQ